MSEIQTDYYKNLNYIEYGGFYIHLHQKQIGAIKNGGKPVKVKTLVDNFNSLRRDAKEALGTQYKELFIENVSSQDRAAVSQLFKDNGNIDKINEVLQEHFSKGLNSAMAQKLIEIQKNIDWESSADSLKKQLDINAKPWKGFDSLLANIAEAIEVLEGCEESAMAAAIRSAGGIYKVNGKLQKTNNDLSLYNIGKELSVKLQSLNLDGSTLKGQQLQQAANALHKIAARLTTGDASGTLNPKDPRPITIQYLKDSIDRNFFSTVLGESAAMMITEAAVETSAVTVKNTVENIKPTGQTSIERISSGVSGSYTRAGKEKIGSKKQGKADVKFNNVQLSLSQIFGVNYGEITLDIGLSNKAYKTLELGKKNNITPKNLVTGGSLPLNTAFNLLISTESSKDRLKYLAYNTLAWSSNGAPSEMRQEAEDLTPAVQALQNALFTRATLYLFGARGIEDFATFMFVNGNLISMWDIVKKILESNKALNTTTSMTANSGVVFSIPGRNGWWNDLNKGNAFDNHNRRVEELNNAINSASIEGHINPFVYMKNN